MRRWNWPRPGARPGSPSLKEWAVSVKEREAPEGAEAVEWMLLTNLPVDSAQSALEKIKWDRLRFQIEVYHRTLKSGCKIEERQLGSAERIESLPGHRSSGGLAHRASDQAWAGNAQPALHGLFRGGPMAGGDAFYHRPSAAPASAHPGRFY